MTMNMPYMSAGMPGAQMMNVAQQPLVKNLPVLYVGDLEELVTEEMLFNYFSKFGFIYSVRVLRDFRNKKSRGFAFVTFYVLREADNARINANHDQILSNPIRVTWKKNLRDMDPEANVFVKQLDPTITVKTLDSFFSQYGTIFTSKIARNEKGSLGYGYVQFETKESASKCLEAASDLKINDKLISVVAFKKQVNREELKKNLYIKNLPLLEESVLQAKLSEICSKFGPVTSLIVKTVQEVKDSQKTEKRFAFVCFAEHEDAIKAQAELPTMDPFDIKENLYANWAENRIERKKKLVDFFQKSTNETNLYTYNLKQTVTVEELKKAFEAFGEVTSCKISVPVEKGTKKYTTNQAYVNFKNKEDAKTALMGASNNENIKEFYNNKTIFITYLIKKEQLNAFKSSQKRQQLPKQMVMDPYLMFNFQQQAMMRNGMNPMAFQQQPFMMGGQNQQFQQPMMQMGGMNKFYPNVQRQFSNDQFQQNNFQQQNRSFSQQPQSRQYNQNQQQQPRNQYPNQQQNRQYGRAYQSNNYYTNQFPRQNNQNNQNKPQVAAQQQVVPQAIVSVANLKEQMSTFLNYDKEKQRTLLGELLFPLVRKHASQEVLAPKITGMLIDFDVFDVSDILEFLDSDEQLKERVGEAEELIKQSTDTQEAEADKE